MKRCYNPRCLDPLPPGKAKFCPSCRYMGKRGLFRGMYIGGVIVALAKAILHHYGVLAG